MRPLPQQINRGAGVSGTPRQQPQMVYRGMPQQQNATLNSRPSPQQQYAYIDSNNQPS